MIIREDMGLDQVSADLGEFGSLRKSLKKITKTIAKPFKAVKKVHKSIKKTLKKVDPVRRLIKGKPKKRSSGAAAPAEEAYEEVSTPEAYEPSYNPGYVPGSSSADYGPSYDPGPEGEEALGPAAPGSDMEVDPYADDGVEDEGDEDEGGEEQAKLPAPLPSAPSVPPPTLAPTAIGEGLPTWVWWTGGAVLVGGGIFWYLKKSGKI